MTLPDIMDKENIVDARQLKSLGQTLNTSIKQALKRKGLTCGMTSCAKLLHSNPGTVMMCVLPVNGNIGVHIHQTLIQAFCQENNILVIEVDDAARLASGIEKLMGQGQEEAVASGNSVDASCVLLQYPRRVPSKHDQQLLQFYEMHSHPLPKLSLPI